MFVTKLSAAQYSKDGLSYEMLETASPTWQQIESAIATLDRFCFPYLWLFLDETETEQERIDVMGGRGAYWLCGSTKGYLYRRLMNPSGSQAEIMVWESDQGFADEERFVTYDQSTIVQAIKHFFDYGDYHPALKWE